MSEEFEAVVSCCASCGVAEIDDVKLKECDGCDLVRYCGDECERDHWSQHKPACKKRAAELRDELLFKQPESSHMGDCPICFLPLPIDETKCIISGCCSKVICRGCAYANKMRENEMRLQQSCPFCRETLPETDEEHRKRVMKRIEMNDPVALCHEGGKQQKKGNHVRAFKYYTKAAALGNAWAHNRLALMYNFGHGAEKDEGKYIHHLEEAAIGGNPHARFCLGCKELLDNGNTERAVKHWIIAATQGEDEAIKWLMDAFKSELVGKEVLATALRAHKAAVDATKSSQREAAEKSFEF